MPFAAEPLIGGCWRRLLNITSAYNDSLKPVIQGYMNTSKVDQICIAHKFAILNPLEEM
ncbi:hypothetical protein CPC08DRAFT_705350 [Agrocybe pediades]|nr:hypothetical protein CPC08DRAFT_705350 [Agrocybe pediades]